MATTDSRLPSSFAKFAAIAAIASVVCATSTGAATYTYGRTASNTSDTADLWTLGTSWSPAGPVSGTDTTLTLTGSVSAGATIFTDNDIAGDFKLNQLNFTYAKSSGGGSTAPQVTISGNRLEFISNGTTTPVLNVAATGTAKPLLTIKNDLLLTNNLSVTASSDAVLSGTITGAGSLTKTSGGIVTLSGANTYSGGTFFGGVTGSAAGTLALGSSTIGDPGAITSGPLGTGTLTLRGNGTGSTIRSTDATDRTINNAISFAGTSIDIHFGSSGTGNLSFGGAVDLNGGVRTFTVDNSNTTFSGAISTSTSGGGITKAGGGTLTVSGANTYNGATTINAGTLKIDNNNTTTARLANTSAITVNTGGTLLFAQSGSTSSVDRLNGAASFTLGGGSLNLGGLSEGAAGTNGVGALTLTATSTIEFGTAATTNLIQFNGLGTHTTGAIMQITNWQGIPNSANGGDQLLFAGSSASFTSAYQQSEVSFNGSFGYDVMDFGSYYEVFAPVPEPSTWAAAAMSLVFVGWTQRWRVRKLVRIRGS